MIAVSWFSGGVSSFVATYLHRKEIDKIIYIDIADQHPDTIRFLHDCEKVLEREIEILRSPFYSNVDNVIRAFRFVNSPYGAKCTSVLKRNVRKDWERKQNDELEYVWGFDSTETTRIQNLIENEPKYNHAFPLLDNNVKKSEAHGVLQSLGIKRPEMYDMGYKNNNCIGCVKGGMGYWNKIRVDFPEVFKKRAETERQIGHSCIKGVFLDELAPDRGRIEKEIMPECGMMCQLI